MSSSSGLPAGVTEADVYRNLNTGTWSVRAFRAPAGLSGRVVAHPDRMELRDVEFRVQASGRDEVRATCRKAVHAFVRGTVARADARWPRELFAPVGYNPYLYDSFVLLENGRPIQRAAWVIFPAPRADGRQDPLRVGLYEEDAALLSLSPVRVSAARMARMAFCRESAAERRRLAALGREPRVANPGPALEGEDTGLDWNG